MPEDGSRLRVRVPADYVLARDACSYGYFLLAPNLWQPRGQSLTSILDLADGPVRVRISQPDASDGKVHPRWGRCAGQALRVACSRRLTRGEQRELRRLVTRMLRLDETSETIGGFHRVDPRWRRCGRGRLFRSPTLFEDIVKTVTSCNIQWPGTVRMNIQLCEVLGREGAFPRPERIARTRASTLRGRCRVGYRDRRLIDLARLFVRGEIDESWLRDPANSDEEVFGFLKTLPGVGPYAAANIMQLLGRYAFLPLDTESVRHGRTVLGLGGSDAQIMRRVEQHFSRFGDHAFRSYWFELWRFYEHKAGPSETWEPREVGASFTASNLGS